jgi:hypothetical protein
VTLLPIWLWGGSNGCALLRRAENQVDAARCLQSGSRSVGCRCGKWKRVARGVKKLRWPAGRRAWAGSCK